MSTGERDLVDGAAAELDVPVASLWPLLGCEILWKKVCSVNPEGGGSGKNEQNQAANRTEPHRERTLQRTNLHTGRFWLVNRGGCEPAESKQFERGDIQNQQP